MKNKCLTRTCISCRAKKDKKELIRIVKNKNGVIKVDLSQRLEGRGAYICEDKNFFDKMQKGNILKSTLKISVDNKKYEELRGVIFDRTE